MNSNSSIFLIGKFDFKLRHLLIIGVLSLSFSTSFLIRSQPASFGWELNEFDPFFNYRATQYIIDNGIDSYFNWHDDLSWYPDGRNVSRNSQVMLHLTAAITYQIFGGGSNLYDFTILFPVVIGSLTTIVIFSLVRVIGGTMAGLLSSMFFAVSLPIILRGSIGWFKSEPLGLFFTLLSLYFFLSGIKSSNHKIAFSKLITSGILITLGLSAWGGDKFFIIPIGIFMLALPFLRNDHKFLLWAIPLFTTTTIISSLSFERLSTDFIFGLSGLSLIVPTIFLVVCLLISNKSKEHKQRNGLLFLAIVLISSSSILVLNADSQFLPLPSHRYLNAINPFLTTTDPLVDSVAEHGTTTIAQSFLFHSILMIFAGLGIWIILSSKKSNIIQNDMKAFSLIIGLIGIYVSSAFVRLEVFASISVIILSSLGLSFLSKEFFSKSFSTNKLRNLSVKLPFFAGIMILLLLPLTFPENNTVFSLTDTPPTILNAGTTFEISTNDWNDALAWIKNNTNEDAVIGAWWDYGYWIQTKGERATLADNATLSTEKIKKIAEIFLSSPEDAWKELMDMNVDYILVNIAGQRLTVDYEDKPLYILGGGADESKKAWFMRIAGEPLPKYLYSDGISATDFFWNDTLLGNLFPFTVLAYNNFNTQQQSASFQPGFTPIYEKNVKFSNDDDPFRLVYASPSFDTKPGKPLIGVFIYEINKNYNPSD